MDSLWIVFITIVEIPAITVHNASGMVEMRLWNHQKIFHNLLCGSFSVVPAMKFFC